MPTQRIPLVGSLTRRDAFAGVTDGNNQRFTNCFPEVVANPITGKSSLYLNKRGGMAASASVQASAVARFGSVVWASNASAGAAAAPVVLSFRKSTNTAMMFFDAETLAQIGADVATAGTANCLFMNESDVGGTGNLTATVVDGTTLEAWFFPAGGAWTQITDGDFPSNIVSTHVHLDGYMFVMTEGARVYNSDLNSLSSWSANNYITANSFGDRGSALARYRNFVVAFGDYSAEFFYNAGNATGSVLSRVPDATIQIGAMRSTTLPPTVRSVGDTVYWIGQNTAGTRGVYRLNGMKAEKISTPAIDKIAANGRLSSIIGSCTLLGMTHVIFGNPTATDGLVIVYCVDTNYWWELDPGTGSNLVTFLGASDSTLASKTYTSIGDSKVYTINGTNNIWRDDGSPYDMIVQTTEMSFGTQRKKFWRALRIVGDETAGSILNIRFSDNESQTFSTPRTMDLSDADAMRMYRWGASRRRTWQLTHSANAACRIEALELDYELGAT